MFYDQLTFPVIGWTYEALYRWTVTSSSWILSTVLSSMYNLNTRQEKVFWNSFLLKMPGIESGIFCLKSICSMTELPPLVNSFILCLHLKATLFLNASVHVLTGIPHRENIQPVVHELHWLPMELQIRFQMLVLTFKALKDHHTCRSASPGMPLMSKFWFSSWWCMEVHE